MKKLNRDHLTLALCIALFPPIWAVLAPHIGIQTGAVALICAAVYSANGNNEKDAPRLSLGFLAGDLWAVLAIWIMDQLPINPEVELFMTLFTLGGVAVLICSLLPKLFHMAAWLGGWAIGLTIMAPAGWEGVGSFPIQIGAAMLVGIWYVGVLVERIHQKMKKE